jgi:hypothetical protein
MKKRFYIGLIVFAILVLALGRLIVCPPGLSGVRRRRRHPRFWSGPLAAFLPTELIVGGVQLTGKRLVERTGVRSCVPAPQARLPLRARAAD